MRSRSFFTSKIALSYLLFYSPTTTSFYFSTKSTTTRHRQLSSERKDSLPVMGSYANTAPSYETLLLDMDGVLAEVSKSYRAAIEATCKTYGAKSVSHETITAWKARGNANDDWKLSHDLILNDPDGQKDVTLEQVTETFEQFYQGHGDTPGLHTLETLIPKRETLEELQKRSSPGIGIVTGRPRRDCMKFLKHHGLEEFISATYCMEDGPSKPDPAPVRRCCELLGIEPSPSVILVGDTPDDVRAALSAGCRAVAVRTPEAKDDEIINAMRELGADIVLQPGFAELVDMFPSQTEPRN